MSLQATATPLMHEEMDIVKSPLIALMKDDVKEVTRIIVAVQSAG